MNKSPKLVLILAGLIFSICLGIGYQLSLHKKLWNDEIYTQLWSVEDRSYGGILFKHMEEGNNCPIFYLIQKAVSDVSGYRFPNRPWDPSYTMVQDYKGQVILRIPANIFTSLTIAVIFYFFARFYSLAAGGYALLVTMSSFMILAYWVEARPYSIWVFLTTLQLLLVLCIVGNKVDERRGWRWLTVTHLVLSFTVIMSIAQVAAVSVVLWLFKERDWRKYLGLTVIPSLITLYYCWRAPKFQFSFTDSPMEVVGASIPKDRLFLILVYALFMAGYYFCQRKKIALRLPENYFREGLAFLMLTGIMLLSAIAVLVKFKLVPAIGKAGFPVSNRHLIYLTPVGIISITLFSIHLFRSLGTSRGMKVILSAAFLALFAFRVYRTYLQMKGFYI